MLAIAGAVCLEESDEYLEKKHKLRRWKNACRVEDPPDVDIIDYSVFERRDKFQNNLQSIIIHGSLSRSLHKIYHTTISKYPGIESTYPFERVVGLMKNWEDGKFLQTPVTLTEYTQILLSETWKNVLTKWDKVEMSVHTVECLDGNCITVFADHSYLQLFNDSTDYKLDVCQLQDNNVPKVDKLMSISVLISNEWWPIAWALIDKSTVETYSAVFHVLNSVHDIMHQPNIIILSYFETQLGDSIDLYFPSSTVICLMNVSDKLDSLHGKNYTSIMLKKAPRISRCYKKLSELNQLRANEIESSFERLFESSKIFDSEFLRKAFKCYREWWIEKIRPERISCFDNRDIKLAKIAKKIESVDLPNAAKWTTVFEPLKIWKFTDRLLEIMIILRNKIHFSTD